MPNALKRLLPLALAAALLPAVPAAAQYDDEEIRQSVARIAYVTGDVTCNRGDDPDTWDAAAPNFPLTIGDRIWTARDGRAQLHARGVHLFVASETELAALNLTWDVQQFSLPIGTLSLRLNRLAPDDALEVDTPNASIGFDRPGEYRIDVDRDGNTRVVVRRGRVTVVAGGGQVPLGPGDEMEIDGIDEPMYDVYRAPRPDSWDRWVESRARRYRGPRGTESVNVDVIGYEDLDAYGSWQDIPGQGMCWYPNSVAGGWAPYRDGRWVWQDPWGWTWVSAEPWGFAPYHYGRWINWASRWYWVPSRPSVRVSYAPALVAFVGGGPGWSASLTAGGGYVGWFPLAPADPFLPWWGRRRVTVAVATDRYVNRSFVTVVRHDTFITGRIVARDVVRDQGVVRAVVSAPVLRGPLPIMPTRASLRVSLATARGERPPQPVEVRAVVTRLAPPPAPPPFSAKVEIIRENRGAPLAPEAASRLSVERHEGARQVVPIRPAAEERIVLKPKRDDERVPRVERIAPPPGKVLATPDRPFVPAPEAASGRSERSVSPAQPAPGAVVPRERDAAPAPRVEREAPPARVDRDREAARERENAAKERDAAAAKEREDAARERETAVRERDAAREREAAAAKERESAVRERDAAREREAARAREAARERENAPPPRVQREAAPPRDREAAPPRERESAPPPRVEREAPPARDAKKDEKKKDDKKKDEKKDERKERD